MNFMLYAKLGQHTTKLGQHTTNFGLTVPPKFDFTVPPRFFAFGGTV